MLLNQVLITLLSPNGIYHYRNAPYINYINAKEYDQVSAV